MPARARIYYHELKAVELPATAQAVRNAKSANASIYSQPPVTMTDLQTKIDDYKTKLTARAGGAHADVLALRMARRELERCLPSSATR